MTFIITVEEDPATGELILPFPPDFLDQQDWREGDELEFSVAGTAILITNKSHRKRQEST